MAECLELLAQSYTEGPVPALKGRTTSELDPYTMTVAGILHKQTTSFGEQSSWQMEEMKSQCMCARTSSYLRL